MRILIVSYAFPPYNDIGHVRVGKTAKYLARFGHDVRVLTANDQPYTPSLPVEIPEEQVERTPWLNVNRPAELLFGGRRAVADRGLVARGTVRPLVESIRWIYRHAYKQWVGFPDDYIGWFPFAVRAGSRLMQAWHPDVLYASAMPYTSLLVAAWLARRFQTPWVAELRDLWVDFHRYRFGSVRRRLEEVLERRVLSSASALVTVSEPLATTLRTKYEKPTAVVLNGFDSEEGAAAEEARKSDPELLRIVYTGMIYEGRQDPSPLFAALQMMGADAQRVRVEFYGRYLEAARESAARMGLTNVVVDGQVPHGESLRLQRHADVLLLLLWTDLAERGVYTGKLFEYIGAGRPILAVGPSGSVASELILQRRLGCVCADAYMIRQQLAQWIAEKRQYGSLAAPPDEAQEGLTREAQTRRLDEFLRVVIPKVDGR